MTGPARLHKHPLCPYATTPSPSGTPPSMPSGPATSSRPTSATACRSCQAVRREGESHPGSRGRQGRGGDGATPSRNGPRRPTSTGRRASSTSRPTTVRPLTQSVLHAARPAGEQPPDGRRRSRGPRRCSGPCSARPGRRTLSLCLLSGGGSALLPAPVGGESAGGQAGGHALLHACGATIDEMNAVRKHLSRVKGGRLAQAFRGPALFSLIVSDVVGDPLDVIASGPTAADPTTFADALAVLDRYGLRGRRSRRPSSTTWSAGPPGRMPETLEGAAGERPQRRPRQQRRWPCGRGEQAAERSATGCSTSGRSSRARRGRSPRPSPGSCAASAPTDGRSPRRRAC